MEEYLATQSLTKTPMPSPVYHLLERWASGDPRGKWEVDSSTFRYIIAFFEGSIIDKRRLPVACADFGYTISELEALKVQGKTAHDVAAEILKRGVDESDE